VEEMQDNINELTTENTQLKMQVETLSAENQSLKEQLSSLQKTSTARGSPSLTQLLDRVTSIKKHSNPFNPSVAAKTAYLLIVFLAFGLFFNAQMGLMRPNKAPLTLLQGPRVIPATFYTEEKEPMQQTEAFARRKLLGVEDSTPFDRYEKESPFVERIVEKAIKIGDTSPMEIETPQKHEMQSLSLKNATHLLQTTERVGVMEARPQ